MAKVVNISTSIYTFEEKNKLKQAHSIQYSIDANGCHICISHAFDKDGYVRVHRHGKDLRGSRYIWSEVNDAQIPEGMVIMHSCDNPRCINPDHLRPGTIQENIADKIAKGRSKIAIRGPRLNKEQAYYIKFISNETYKSLAEKFGVSIGVINGIKIGRTWKWLEIEDGDQAAA